MPRIEVVEAGFVAGAKQPSELPPPKGVEIAFAGRSNVGKSSLMNALMHRRNLVRTSSTPGCTRQISWFEARCADDAVVTLVDLPGYGYAKRSKAELAEWGRLIDHYLLERPTLAVVAILVDTRRGLEQEELDLVELLQQPPQVSRRPLELQIVGTKTDRMKSNERGKYEAALKKSTPLPVACTSVQDAESINRLWRQLRKLASVGVAM